VSGVPSGPSRTSRSVAVTRATFDRPHTPAGDPLAQVRLCENMPAHMLSSRIPSLRTRTRFFDDAVLHALAHDISQIVILGAGYDDRALRFRSSGTRFIEVDQAATQIDKRARLAAIGVLDLVTLVPGDFTHDEIASVLAGAGHDPDRASLFICEGLLVYLDQPTIVRLLTGLRDRAHARSRLAVSLGVHADDVDNERFLAIANAKRLAGATEPWLTILPLDEHLALLTRSGWSVERTIDQADLDESIPRRRSMLVLAGTGDAATSPGDAP
jgi:methyltransferase (TIGR00027 family)